MEIKKKILNSLLEKLKKPEDWRIEYLVIRYKETKLELWTDSNLSGVWRPYELKFGFFDNLKLKSAVSKVYNELKKNKEEKQLQEILKILND